VSSGPAPFDPLASLRALDRHGVRFVVIGGLGARLHGSPSVTNDLDICFARDGRNLEALGAALRELGATLRGVADDVPFTPDAPTLAAGDHFTFMTDAGALDCLGAPAGVGGFEDLTRDATTMRIDDLDVLVASVDDLIRMKRAAGRPKDLVEIEVLGALREESERG
jgi:hypothetical protein